ncbi:glycerol acyltransferase, partial [Streptomyces sp. NPDC056437]
MADAKVIPFDDDRSRGSAQRAARRRPTGGTSRRKADPGGMREMPMSPLPAQQPVLKASDAPDPEPPVQPPAERGGGWDRR